MNRLEKKLEKVIEKLKQNKKLNIEEIGLCLYSLELKKRDRL